VAIAAGLLALGVYGISRLDPPEPRAAAVADRRVASAAAPAGGAPAGGAAGGAPGRAARAPSSRPTGRATASRPDAPQAGARERTPARTGQPGPGGAAGASAAPAATDAARADGREPAAGGGEAGGAGEAAPVGAAAGATPVPGREVSAEVGVSVTPEALRGGSPPGDSGGGTTRTVLALEPVDTTPGAVTAQRLAPDSGPGSSPARAGAPGAAGSAGTPPAPDETAAEGTRGRWLVSARAPGTQRLRVVALDVRDSAGRVDTTARRELATVEVPLGGAPGGAVGAPLEASNDPSRSPVAWIATCLLSFLLGWLARGRGRAAAPGEPGEPVAAEPGEDDAARRV